MTITRTPHLTLAAAHDVLHTAVAGVTDWTLPTPCSAWTVTQVLQHAAGDQLGYAAALTGTGGPAFDPFSPSGHLDADPGEFLKATLRASAEAFAAVSADDPAVPTPLPLGPLPAEIAIGACALDAAVHAWDIAVATGQPSPLSPELAASLRVAADQVVEPLRAFAYAPALAEAPADDAAAALLRFLGRDPEWTAARA